MKRFVLAVAMAVTTLTGLQPSVAGDHDWYRSSGYGYPTQPYCPQPVQPVQQGNPLLKKLLVGGLLVGVGFVAGRLTSPKPQPYYSGYGSAPFPGHYPPACGQRVAHRHH